MSSMFKAGAALSGLLLLSVAGCSQAPPPAPAAKAPSPASQQWAKLSNSFVEGYLLAQPFFAARAGRHEFDGQMPDLSAHGIKREIARLHDQRDQLQAVDPATLQPIEQFQREYLLTVVDGDLFWLEKARYPFSNPYWYLNNIDPDMYLSRNYAPLDVRMKAFIKYARNIPKIAADIRENLQSPLPKSFIELGIADFGGFVDFYAKDVAQIFASVQDPDLQKQLADADTAAAQAMSSLKDYLVSQRAKGTDKFALGTELFAQMVQQTERVDVPVEQIEAVGRADLERNTAALKAECALYLPKGTLQACVAKVAANKPKNGPLARAREQLVMLKEFVQKNHVATIPSNEEALVAESPSYNRSNAAFIQLPGPYDHGVAAVYNISPPDPKWSKADQAAYIPSEATLLGTSVHEVWPGHFLQFMHSNADPVKLEGLWVGYAYSEGWAHYCEEMVHEMGLGKGEPETHIAQLTDALLRDVRLLSSIGMHTHGMTMAQSEKMFKEQAFQDPGDARQEAARGTFDPAYMNYTLGKLMIRKLRTDWIAKRLAANPGSTAAGAAPADSQALWHDFHDEFLSHGGPPIPVLRKLMMGEEGSVL
jgi:uncharacterized protein (DUF885 family)